LEEKNNLKKTYIKKIKFFSTAAFIIFSFIETQFILNFLIFDRYSRSFLLPTFKFSDGKIELGAPNQMDGTAAASSSFSASC